MGVGGGMDGRLYAVKSETGDKLWSYELGTKIRSALAISNGVLVFPEAILMAGLASI